MFEDALQSLRPRRRGSVLLSTGLHAALVSALVFPPMLRMPELAAEPPDNLPKFVDLFQKPPLDEPTKTQAPETPPPPRKGDLRKADGPGRSVRVVVPPTVIGELPVPLAPGERNDVREVLGSHAYEIPGDGGEGTEYGNGVEETGGEGTTLPANALGVTAPVPLSAPPPVYPEVMRIAGVEGVVILEAVIGRDGLVRDVRVMRGVNPLLDRTASTAVLSWRYRPALVNDHPVAVYLTVTISFRITR